MNAAQLAGGGIKSIQRGTIAMPVGTSSNSATVTAVDTTKSELRMLGCTFTTTDGSARIALSNSTTVSATIGSTTSNTVVSWELVERY